MTMRPFWLFSFHQNQQESAQQYLEHFWKFWNSFYIVLGRKWIKNRHGEKTPWVQGPCLTPMSWITLTSLHYLIIGTSTCGLYCSMGAFVHISGGCVCGGGRRGGASTKPTLRSILIEVPAVSCLSVFPNFKMLGPPFFNTNMLIGGAHF